MDNANNISGTNINGTQKGKNILEIICLENKKIRLRATQSYKVNESEPALSSYIKNRIDLGDIEGSIREIDRDLRRGNIFRDPVLQLFSNLFTEFKKSCKVLHNELFSPEIKSSLQDSSYKDKGFILGSLTAYHLVASF